MKNFRNYLQLHLNILLFSLTSVFSKLASIQKRLPSVVADLGSDHLSRAAFSTEYSRNPDRIIWSMDGAAL